MKNKRLEEFRKKYPTPEHMKADIEEYAKCMEDPVYCYNKYFRPDGARELTKEKYEDLLVQQEMYRNGLPPYKFRNKNFRIKKDNQ